MFCRAFLLVAVRRGFAGHGSKVARSVVGEGNRGGTAEGTGMPMMRGQRSAGSVLVLDAKRVYGGARSLRQYGFAQTVFVSPSFR